MQRTLFALTICLACAILMTKPAGALMDPLENVIHFSPASTNVYLGSPSLLRLPNGDILASMDLRCNSMPVVDKAAIVNISQDGRTESFDPKTGFIDFPGGMSKFAIRYDEKTKRYWTLANGNTNPNNPQQRNSLAAYSSDDLRYWRFHEVMLEDLDDFYKIGTDSKVGFQYVDFRFDRGDIIFMSRTAYKGAHNYHDANFMTFHRIPNFRERYK